MSDTATPDTGTDTTADVEVNVEVPDPAALAAEVDKWKALAQKHEGRAKANAEAAKELENVKLAALSDTEKAVELARQQARSEAFTEIGGQLVELAFTAATAGRGIDVAALLDGVDRTRFLTEDGRADQEAINAWVDRIVPKPEVNVFPDLGQGARGASAMALNGDPLLQSVISKLKS